LNKYKLTDYKYNTLSTSLNTSNLSGFGNSNYANNSNSSKRNTNSFQSSSGGSIGYTSTNHNRKYDGNQSVGFGFSGSFTHNDSNDLSESPLVTYKNTANSSNSASTIWLNFKTNNRFYLSNDYYFGINFQTYSSPHHSYLKAEQNNNGILQNNSVIVNSFSSNNEASFYFGKGRIENVTDARLAIYILDDLSKQGRLSKTPSQEEVFAFADFITKTLNKRVIDSRIKRIQEFVAVDSFLVSNGLSNKTDGLYFGLINDNWNYGRLQYWGTGSLWHFGVSPSFDYQNYFSRSVNNSIVSKEWSRLNQYGISIDAGYTTSWISGIKWINGYDINASFNILKLDSTGYYYDVHNYKSITGYATYNVSYIPNTRTTLTCSAGITFEKDINKGTNDELQINPLISGSCNYYFSEKLRLQVNANINYNYYKIYDYTHTQNTLNFWISATLSYYIF